MATECMVTIDDNPYDYFTQFVEWQLWDKEQGYNTCEYLARIVNLTEDMSQVEEDREIERACDEIVKININGKYIKKYREA